MTHVEFSLASENRSRTTRSRFLQSFALPDENCSPPAFLKKNYKKISHQTVRFVFRLKKPSVTNDLRVNIATSLHWKFSCPLHASFTIFRVLTLVPLLKPLSRSQKIHIHVVMNHRGHNHIKKQTIMRLCCVYLCCAVSVLCVWPRVKTGHNTQHRNPRHSKNSNRSKL